jgi:flagellum-specific ATP synthase
MTLLQQAMERVSGALPMRVCGRVAALRGLTVFVHECRLPVGALVEINQSGARDKPPITGEVVGFSHEQTSVMALGSTEGIRPGDVVVGRETRQTGPVGGALLGRVIDGLGRPIDGTPLPPGVGRRSLAPPPIGAMQRARIDSQIFTGVRAIDAMTPIGRGQRLGIFAGPGVGKSTLLGTIAQRAHADVNVIALIGERGREVREFLEHSLGPEGLARSVVVVATGDESPLMRLRAAKLACTIAEEFREAGRDVLLMMDSITRFAHAQRQVGLSVGEPPASKGYTPSVFSELALLLERAGPLEGGRGSITGLYTVLVEGDDMTEPVADAARGILDGHIILARKLAQRAHYPAIDILDSVSRVADEVTPEQHGADRRQIMRLLAAHREVEELVQIGAYVRGQNPETDVAIDAHRRICDFLRQEKGECPAPEEALKTFQLLAAQTRDEVSKGRRSGK